MSDYTRYENVDPDEMLEVTAEILHRSQAKGIPKHVLLVGPPGTTKTSTAHAFAKAINGKQALSYQCHEEMGSSDLIFSFLPTPEGGATRIDGVVIRGFVEGNSVVFDEINHSVNSPAISIMHKVMDTPELAIINMPDGSVVRPAKGFSVWATMNGLPEELPPAVLDRFDIVICMWRPTNEALASLPFSLRPAAKRIYGQPSSEDPWPSFRDFKRFAELCDSMGVDAGEINNEVVRKLAKLVWAYRASDALHIIHTSNTAAREEADSE